jgi:Family of unknown function (DUF6152)
MKNELVLLVAMAILAAAPLAAHHSFAAEYDSTKPISVTGTVTKIEWLNPHARLYVDVKDDKGEVTNWNFEFGGPLQLKRLGWRRDTVKVGDEVKIEGYMAKDGSHNANGKKIMFADGRKILPEPVPDTTTTQ